MNQHTRKTRIQLDTARRPLGQIDPADVRSVVARVVAVHHDVERITAAKFSSAI